MKKGRSLELLVEALEKNLSDDSNILIESPKRLLDIHTGNQREHDVLITLNQSHHKVIVAIECKDRSRPVGVPDIEAFESKCRSTNINQGIIVSSSGFCGTAKDKAKRMNLRCIEVKDIDRTDFLTPDAQVVLHSLKFLKAIYTPISNETSKTYIGNYNIYTSKGLLITDEILVNNLREIEDIFPYGELGEEVTKEVIFKTDNYYLKESNKYVRHPITGIKLDVTYTYEVSKHDLRTRSYQDVTGNNLLAKVATAEVILDGNEEEFTLIQNKDKTTVQFISEDN